MVLQVCEIREQAVQVQAPNDILHSPLCNNPSAINSLECHHFLSFSARLGHVTAEFVFAGEYLAAVSAGELARAVDVLHVPLEVGHDGLTYSLTPPSFNPVM